MWKNYERRCTDPWMVLNGGAHHARSWRRADFPEAWLLRATSSTEACEPSSWCTVTIFSQPADARCGRHPLSMLWCIRAEQCRNFGPQVVTIWDSQFLGNNIDSAKVVSGVRDRLAACFPQLEGSGTGRCSGVWPLQEPMVRVPWGECDQRVAQSKMARGS